MKTRNLFPIIAFTSLFISSLVVAAPATPVASVTPTNDCAGPQVDLRGLVYQVGATLTIGMNGNVCPGTQWSQSGNSPGDTQVMVNKAEGERAGLGDQRVAITKVQVAGATHVSDVVAVDPLMDNNKRTLMRGLNDEPFYVGIKDINKVASFVSNTHFDTNANGETKLTSITQCYSGSCLNVNVDSCGLLKDKVNAAIKSDNAKDGGKRPELKTFDELLVRADECRLVGQGAEAARAMGWATTPDSVEKGKKLYEHDINTIKNSAAINAKDRDVTNLKPYVPQTMVDNSRNLNNFIRGCNRLYAQNGGALVNSRVATPAAPRAPAKKPGAQ